MRTSISIHPCRRRAAYALIEALVYIGLVFLVIGTAFVAMYRLVDNSVVLRRNAQDIASALHAGERWRADVRRYGQEIQLGSDETSQTLMLRSKDVTVLYRFETNTVMRQMNNGLWIPVLQHLRSSSMEADARPGVAAWRWDVELLPRSKGRTLPSRLRPLFTFLAVPEKGTANETIAHN